MGNDVLKISIQSDQKNNGENLSNNYHFKKLTRLGFRVDEHTKSIVQNYDMQNFKDAMPIKTLISRVIYNIYQYNEFDAAFIGIKS